MFGQDQTTNSKPYPFGNPQIPAAPPSEYGIKSAMAELAEEVSRSTEIGYDLKSALGISTPATNEANAQLVDSSLVGTIRSMASSLRSSNAQVAEAVRHLRV